MGSLGLYIHIPFCVRRCYYCDFVSYVDRLGSVDRYIDAVILEATQKNEYLSNNIVDTIFIGGGTPTILTPSKFEAMVVRIRDIANLNIKEFTVEANPETINEDKLIAYRKAGVNRLSFGVQSHDNSILQRIGRRHTFEQFQRAYSLSKKYFDNISIDIMFGLPGQLKDNFKTTIDKIIDLEPKHVSCYALKLEKGTVLYEEFDGVDEDTDRHMYHEAVSSLVSLGYVHYETSNFAKPGYECIHNLKYWTGEKYLGLGVAASSYDGNYRSTNTSCLDSYIKQMNNNESASQEKIYISSQDKEQEFIMLRLRLSEGIIFSDYKKTFATSFLGKYNDVITLTEKAGLIVADKRSIKPTLKGFDLQNTLISEFMKKM